MADESINEKAKKIAAALPRENCGKCGYQNCGRFALAVAKGEISPFGCYRNPSAGNEISRILGIETELSGSVAPAGAGEAGATYGHGHNHKGHHAGHHSHAGEHRGGKMLSLFLGHHSKKKHY